MTRFADLVVAAAVLVVSLSLLVVTLITSVRIDHLQHRVSCLEHPFGASSIAATKVNGRFVVTRPAHRTGCP